MPADGNIRTPTSDAIQNDTWQPVGKVAARVARVAALKRAVESAYHQCDDDAAGDAHDELCAEEWRLRQDMKRARSWGWGRV